MCPTSLLRQIKLDGENKKIDWNIASIMILKFVICILIFFFYNWFFKSPAIKKLRGSTEAWYIEDRKK